MKIVESHQDPISKEWITEEYDLDSAPEDVRRRWYSGACSGEELERVINPKTAQDYLLKIRAEAITDNTRISRLFAHLRRLPEFAGKGIECFFEDYPYRIVKKYLNKADKIKCKDVAGGSLYINTANGEILQTPCGPVSTFSHTLKYFSKFSTLALKDFGDRVPDSVRSAALGIAVRIHLQTEAPDFEMDPRGIIPPDIDRQLNNMAYYQSVFIAGHELGHYILGHLDDSPIEKRSILKPKFSNDYDPREYQVYSIKKRHEFEADITALNRPLYPEDFYEHLYYATLNWFAALAIAEAAEDYLFPPDSMRVTHPSAKARYKNILENARQPKNLDERYVTEILPAIIEANSKEMIEMAQCYTDKLETYGSVYLAPPNTEWRGRELRDRIDY